MRHTAKCGLSGSTLFFPYYLVDFTIFEKKFIEHSICVLTFCTKFSAQFSF